METDFQKFPPVRFLDRGLTYLLRRLGPRFSAGRPEMLRRLLWLTLILPAVMLCIPHRLWNNLAAPVFVLGMLAVYWVSCIRRETAPLPPSALGGGLWIFLLVLIVSTLWAVAPGGHIRVLIFYITGFLFIYVSAGLFRDPLLRRRFMGCLYTVLFFLSAFGLLEVLFGFGNIKDSDFQVGGNFIHRLCSTVENSNNAGECMAMLLPLSVVWAWEHEDKRERFWYLAFLLMPALALLLTFSRTGWVAVLVAIMVLLGCINWRYVFIVPVLGVFLLPFLPDMLLQRVLSIFHPTAENVSRRYMIWQDSLRLLQDHWLLGTGLGLDAFRKLFEALPNRITDYLPPHSNMGYLQIFLETGVVGFAAFLSFFFGIPLRLIRQLRAGLSSPERMKAVGVLASLCGMAVAFVPEHVWFYPRCLYLWCIIAGLAISFFRPLPPGKRRRSRSAS